MCGRTACTLQPEHIRKCCTYVNKEGYETVPEWVIEELYKPCYNLGPTKHSPVIISTQHVNPSAESDGRILHSMKWGLNVYGFGSKPMQVINARGETLLEKNTFKHPLKAGKRCVVLADGYYEWFRQGKVKEPYFIHVPQRDGYVISEALKLEDTDDNKCPRLLAIAGVFDTIKDGDTSVFGYVVITVPASQAVAHIHDRMPAILETDAAIANWLDYGSIDPKIAIDQLKPVEDVKFYRVSTCVNNVRNNTVECIQPFTAIKDNVKAKPTLLDNWLKRAVKSDECSSPSKIKKESEG